MSERGKGGGTGVSVGAASAGDVSSLHEWLLRRVEVVNVRGSGSFDVRVELMPRAARADLLALVEAAIVGDMAVQNLGTRDAMESFKAGKRLHQWMLLREALKR